MSFTEITSTTTQYGNSTTAALEKKWSPMLEDVKDHNKKSVMAQLFENQFKESKSNSEFLNEASTTTTISGNVANYDTVLFSMLRKSLPSMIAFDICGVQAMSSPTGLIFAMRPTVVSGPGQQVEIWDETNLHRNLSGQKSHAVVAQNYPYNGGVDFVHPHDLENKNAPFNQDLLIGGNINQDALQSTPPYPRHGAIHTGAIEQSQNLDTLTQELSFDIDKLVVTAQTRALRAGYSVELAQDMKAIHGLSAEQELINIMTSEIISDINREIINTVLYSARLGSQGATTAGVFDMDLDSNGRWSVERFKGLIYQIERDANSIAQTTRRGKGNFVICSPDVASALAMTGLLDSAPALQNSLDVDPQGNIFAGVLLGKYKIYVDPYASTDYYCVGYKGTASSDAGIFYAPYVPLQLYKTVDSDNMQPRLAFKTRYGIAVNPFAQAQGNGNMTSQEQPNVIIQNANRYYRKARVRNII